MTTVTGDAAMACKTTGAADAATPRPLSLRCRNCGARTGPAPSAICGSCLGPLEPVYDATRRLPDRDAISRRPPSLWRYREWLPFEGDITRSVDSGFTPLIEAPRLARRLRVRSVWIKNDAVCHPTLSFKDRVVAVAINAAAGFGLGTIGCASTGNLANAVGAHARRAGLDAWIFIPADVETGKIVATTVFGANLVRVSGTYDDVNRLCAQVADRFGWGMVNVNLRSYYGEGSKTVAFEIAEQLGWRLPTAVVCPMAGGSLLTKLHKGFGEFRDAGLISGTLPRFFGTQGEGCAPIVRLVERGDSNLIPEIPTTIAKSLAIGSPPDGVTAAEVIRRSGGWASAATDSEIVTGIRVLAEDVGVFAETAGGVTVAGAIALARSGHLKPDDEVVLCITGNGLKTVEAVSPALPSGATIRPRFSDVAALVEEVSSRVSPPSSTSPAIGGQ